MAIGPIQAVVIGFPDNDAFEGRIAEELARLSRGALRSLVHHLRFHGRPSQRPMVQQ